MNRFLSPAIALLLAATAAFTPASAEKLVIMHTNDTHSHIDPEADGSGGILRRKSMIDSIRQAEQNTLLIDAGDFVQGSLYFYLYGGKIEQELMNRLGYDMRILGNHEFDIGADSIAKILKDSHAELIATNYDLSGSALDSLFKPMAIKEFDGRRIGFFAINLDPEGMIAPGKADGVRYLDGIQAANAAAWWLRNIEHCDMVVALTHIGYNTSGADLTDIALASGTRNIDLIIGGHSHDVVQPGDSDKPDRIRDLDGHEVTIVQAGKYGRNLGKIDIDLDNLAITPTLLPVDSKAGAVTDTELAEWLVPYRQGLDSLYADKVFRASAEMPQGSEALKNFLSDFIYDRATESTGGVDFAIMNDGGIRRGLPKGNVGKGYILEMLPFGNSTVVLDIKGSDLADAFDVMAQGRVTAVSRQVDVEYTPAVKNGQENTPGKIQSIRINGRPLDPDRTYRIATIDYLADGGDYMKPLLRARKVSQSDSDLAEDIIRYYQSGKGRGKTIKPDNTHRFH
ncbi:MAG: bifunctional metallophosphatase/5'-nucleotidase [Muribaculaceae bacterium]|nr:bifunctional metallophosphatase/5'-nucleotidase [Muribaculaceae bacterium]MDE5929979.1 bifunctional metallophosphatase/5'-nucleotidase [Muribaculaceae bacterium]MDE6130123.1 bifunctional metallophosphatase/5'-nucleotidase [Muribaculaceae bacterium]